MDIKYDELPECSKCFKDGLRIKEGYYLEFISCKATNCRFKEDEKTREKFKFNNKK